MSTPLRLFIPSVAPESSHPSETAWWFVFRRGEVLLYRHHLESVIPRLNHISELNLTPRRTNYLGQLDQAHVYAAELDDDSEPPEGLGFHTLRSLYGQVDEQLFDLAGRASQILEWDRTHQFCGRCGAETGYTPSERAKKCPACGLLSFPRLSPAVIVLVERGDEVLLARHTRTTDGMYALLAGFVEPGESLEEAVRREIREESGIEVDRITYFGSQPWPFPHSLMIGFMAQYAGGEMIVDGIEIADARWFSSTAMPKVPPKLSIARKLIDAYATRHGVVIDQP